MKAPNITRGEWFTSKTATGKAKVVDKNNFSIAHCTSGSISEQSIDATAIAAVPDLLEALIGLLRLCKSFDIDAGVDADIAEAALLKAGCTE